MGEHIFFLDPLVQELFFLKNYWFKSVPYSWKYNQSIPLLLMSRALNNFLNPFMFDDGEQQRTGRGRPRAATETLCCSSQSEHTREIFFFFVCFLSFFVFLFSFFGLLRRLLQICRGLLIWLLQKVLTRSPYVTNIEIISIRCVTCSPNEGRAHIVDHCQRHPRISFLKSKKFEARHFILKIF